MSDTFHGRSRESLIEEIRELLAVASSLLGRHTLYCGGDGLPFAGDTDRALFERAQAALEPKP